MSEEVDTEIDVLPPNSFVLLTRSEDQDLAPKVAIVTDHDFPQNTANQVVEWMEERGAVEKTRRRFFTRRGERFLKITTRPIRQENSSIAKLNH